MAGRPQSLKNVNKSLFYLEGKTASRDKKRDMIDLLKFIYPIKHDYHKNLTANQNDESSHTADEEDIYIADKLFTNNIL